VLVKEDIRGTISNDSLNQTIFIKYRSNLKILGTCREDHKYQMSPEKNLVATATGARGLSTLILIMEIKFTTF